MAGCAVVGIESGYCQSLQRIGGLLRPGRLGRGQCGLAHAHVGRIGIDRQSDQTRGTRQQQTHRNRPAKRIALWAAIEEGPAQEDQEERRRQNKRADDFIWSLEVLENLEEEHEVPFRPRLIGL